MKKLIVIPARGGSKGIPKKNIYPVNGKPLLEYTLDVIQKAGLPDTDVAVSTDSEEIMAVASNYEGVFLISRPAEISGDMASTEDALIHAVDRLEKRSGKQYGAVLTLQATSPLRKAETLRAFTETFEQQYPAIDALVSLNENRSDFWIKTERGCFKRLYKDAPRRRQDRMPLFVENSAYYITETEALRKTHSVLGTRMDGFVISDVEAIDINEPMDLAIAESFLKQDIGILQENWRKR